MLYITGRSLQNHKQFTRKFYLERGEKSLNPQSAAPDDTAGLALS
ncbi:hypothetical protein [Mesorhizobium sp. M1142]